MIMIMSIPSFFAQIEAACTPSGVRAARFAAGEAVFRQGDPSPGLALVTSGKVSLMRWTASGRAVKIHTALAGETFAEASLFVPACHCDAVAVEPTQLSILRKRDVLGALEADPKLATEFMLHLAGRLMQARRLLELRAMAPLTEAVLVRIAELADADGWLPTEQPLLSLATDIGVTAPALYRALAALERDGDIERPSRGRVRLPQNISTDTP